MMLTAATLEMMWSTPKITVAMAWSRPPTMLIPIAPSTPAQAPGGSRSSRTQVPRIIPSRPMLTTPGRSGLQSAEAGQHDGVVAMIACRDGV